MRQEVLEPLNAVLRCGHSVTFALHLPSKHGAIGCSVIYNKDMPLLRRSHGYTLRYLQLWCVY